MKFILIILGILVQTISANIIAILEITIGDNVELTIDETRHLTDELRKMARETLPQKFTVLTRDAIMQLLPPDEEEASCLADGCAVDIGRAISADYVTQGQIRKFGDRLTLTVELFDTMSGNLLSSYAEVSEDLMGLLKIIGDKSAAMFEKLSEPLLIITQVPGPQPKATEPSAFKIGLTARAGFASDGFAYSVGLIAVKNLGILDVVPEVRFSVDDFKIDGKDISILKIDVPLTARVVFLNAFGLSAGIVAAVPLSSKIDGETPKDAAKFGIAATAGLSYLITSDIFIGAFYEKYFMDNFKSVKNSNADRILCAIGYLF
jgi:hypothetical protein